MWKYEALVTYNLESQSLKREMDKLKQQWEKGIQFFKDVEVEGRRISWPSVKETIRSTGAVIVISAILTSFLGLVDFLFSLIVKYILS